MMTAHQPKPPAQELDRINSEVATLEHDTHRVAELAQAAAARAAGLQRVHAELAAELAQAAARRDAAKQQNRTEGGGS